MAVVDAKGGAAINSGDLAMLDKFLSLCAEQGLSARDTYLAAVAHVEPVIRERLERLNQKQGNQGDLMQTEKRA